MSSDKLSFKDALLEAGVRDYHSIEKDGSWTPSGKLEAGMEKLIGDQRPARRFFCSPLFKGVAIAASFAVLFGVLASVKPVREAFGSMFAHTTETEDTTGAVVTDGETTKELTGTDPLPEKTAQISETAPAPVTVPAATEAETEPDPQTEEEWIDYLLGKLAKNGYDDTTWAQLLSFGEAAYERCAKRYQKGLQHLRLNEDGVISFMIMRFVSDDVNKNAAELFENMSLPDPDRMTEKGFFGELKTRQWISAFRSKLRAYAKKKKNKEIAEESPSLYKYLCWIGFDDYICDAETEDIYACFEFIAKASDRGYPVRRELKEKRFDEALEYCVKHRNDTDIPDNVRTAMGRYLQEIIWDEIYKIAGRFENGRFYYHDNMKDYTQAFIEYALGVLPECCEEEAEKEFPVTYRIMSMEGFDNYKPGDPDITFYTRDAVRAAAELFYAVRYGELPEGLSADYNNVTYGISSEKFYEYFDRYISDEIVRGAVTGSKGNEALRIVDGELIFTAIGPQSPVNVKYMRGSLIQQTGNRYVISVTVGMPDGMFGYDREMTFEVTEYADGMRLTGGTFAEKMLTPCLYASQAASYVLSSYCVLREGQNIYSGAAYNLLSGTYESMDEIPKEYRDMIKADAEFPVCLIYRTDGEIPWLRRYTTDEIYNELTKETDVYDGKRAVYPRYAETKTTPAFEHGYVYEYAEGEYATEFLTSYDVLLAMNVTESSEDRIVFSLDFVREENGKSKNMTYTFEADIRGDYCVITGGTFCTDVIMAK